MIIDPTSGKIYKDLKAWKISTSRLGYTASQQENIYNTYFYNLHVCPFPGCGQPVPFSMLKDKACCRTHYNQARRIRLGVYKIEDFKYACQLDGLKFIRASNVGDHLRSSHGYGDKEVEEYYLKYYDTSDSSLGKCKWCGAAVPFRTLETGYANFCYNTDCNVRWYNQYTGRSMKAGESIKKAMSSGDITATQLGYWLKKGLSEAEAKAKLSDRQTTNSVAAIMKRTGLSEKEAKKVRSEITAKWSKKTHTGAQWSRVSQTLFWKVWESIKNIVGQDDVFFATFDKGSRQEEKNLEYRLQTADSSYKLDFYIYSLKILIEFDGEYWHSKSYRPDYPDSRRDANITNFDPGIKVHRVRERDFINAPDDVIKKCVDTIYARLANN